MNAGCTCFRQEKRVHCKDAYNLVAQEKDSWHVAAASLFCSVEALDIKAVRTIDMVDLLFINAHAELPELIQARLMVDDHKCCCITWLCIRRHFGQVRWQTACHLVMFTSMAFMAMSYQVLLF